MKKLFFAISLMLVTVLAVNAQNQFKLTVYDDSTTSVSATAVYLTIELSPTMLGESLSLQGECTNIGGTSEGTVRFQASMDSLNWEDVNTLTYPYGSFTPNDTVTITDGQGYHVVIPEITHIHYRSIITGGANDTTGVDQDYVIW